MAANDESELIAQELSVWGAKNSVQVGNRRFTGVTRILAPPQAIAFCCGAKE